MAVTVTIAIAIAIAIMMTRRAGKTTLLDALRGTSVAEREAGGITQGVAAFSVAMRAKATAVGDRRAPGGKAPKAAKDKGKDKNKGDEKAVVVDGEEPGEEAEAAAALAGAAAGDSSGTSSALPTSHVDVMTFLDTPGHALFSSMRQRGAALTDIVVLVVDGKDGVMPQTRECVETILREGVPVVVAVTKCDLVERTAAVDNISRQLLELGLATDAYGGDALAIPVSAKVRLPVVVRLCASVVAMPPDQLYGAAAHRPPCQTLPAGLCCF